MKNFKTLILLASIFAFSMASKAQVTVQFINNIQPNFPVSDESYLLGVFHTTPISGSGCPTTALTSFYHDIPNTGMSIIDEARDENGDYGIFQCK